MRISERHALRSYIDDTAIDRLVDVVADGTDRLHAVIDAASPVLLPVPQAARLTAALGQVACWAATNSANDAQPATALIETAATAVTEWAMAIERAGSEQVALVSADTAVRTRHALETFADKLAAGTWTTPRQPGVRGSKTSAPWLTWTDAALGHAVGHHRYACRYACSTSCSATSSTG